MDILKAEIERKRKLLEEKKLVGPDKKYFKKSELNAVLDEEYRNRELLKKGILATEIDTKAKELQNENANAPHSSDNEERRLPRKEVVRRLRDRNEPVTLFGETEIDSFKRLRKLEILEPELDRGLRNDFQEALEKVDQALLDDLMKSGGSDSNNGKGKHDVKVDNMDTTIEEIVDLAKDLGKKRDDARDSEIILKFLKFLLELWGKQLNARPEEEKSSTKGKIAVATYTQTQDYLKPLFRQLKNGKVAEDILRHLIIIARHLLERNYVKASDAYLQMAIGNAPWPIGVTMVGIHARTGREKIFSQNIAHVLNDETQRKYVQALKRLMTQCQRLFPTTPSRSVEYNALD